MAFFATTLSAIKSKFDAALTINGGLRYGRVPPSTARPYAVYNVISETPDIAFTPDNLLSDFVIQFSVFDTSAANAAALLDQIDAAFHRSAMTIAGGECLGIIRLPDGGSGINLMPLESGTGQDIYMAWGRYRFTVDS